jgi:glycosyltransferase involved in cell wall biosynthesis
MAMPAFRASATFAAGRRNQSAPLPSRLERLAIVSTSSKLCGIAAYTAALCRQLDASFDITVFDLNQYLLRSPHRHVRKLADRHIRKICRALRQFDAVNLQLEYGTLGRYVADIERRLHWLTNAAPRLSVTFHTLLTPTSFPAAALAKAVVTFDFKTAAGLRSSFRRNHLLSQGVARHLRRIQRRKQVSAIVHNRRDLYDVRYLYGLDHVFDHPLAYQTITEVEATRSSASRTRFPLLDELPGDAVLVGVFGFLNEYKGVATAIRALQHLSPNYHLLVFGGVHPQEIAPRQPRHPYLSSLYDDAYIDRTVFDELGGASEVTPQLVVNADPGLRQLLGAHPRDLSARLHFMGALAESEFLSGMAICDAVVFPYLEVGQSSSGPISQALELGCRIIASRTHTFLEFAEYHKDAVEFFDIGNHLELAERLTARRQFAPRPGLPEFNVETNTQTYVLANSPISAAKGRGRTLGLPAARQDAFSG